jgi:hypothetical protein
MATQHGTVEDLHGFGCSFFRTGNSCSEPSWAGLEEALPNSEPFLEWSLHGASMAPTVRYSAQMPVTIPTMRRIDRRGLRLSLDAVTVTRALDASSSPSTTHFTHPTNYAVEPARSHFSSHRASRW